MPTRECISQNPTPLNTTNKVSKTENLIRSCAASLVVVGDACVLPMRTALKKIFHPPPGSAIACLPYPAYGRLFLSNGTCIVISAAVAF